MLVRSFAALALAILSIAIPAAPAAAHDEVTGPPDVTILIGNSLEAVQVTVAPGDIVQFKNVDDERHRMRARTKPEDFDTGNLEPGEAALVRLTAPGSYPYRDELDDDDTRYHGRIVVEAASTGAGAATPDGVDGAPDAATITIGDRVFTPGSVVIAAGGTVTWDNVDGDEHTATSTDGGPIDSPVLGSGESYAVEFPIPGTFAFICAIHTEMRGDIEVLAATASAPAADTAPAAAVPSAEAPAAEAPADATTVGPSASPAAAAAGIVESGAAAPPSAEPVPADAAAAPIETTSADAGLAAATGPMAAVLLVVVGLFLFMRTVGGAVRPRAPRDDLSTH